MIILLELSFFFVYLSKIMIMLDTNLHDGLESKILRDFFQTQLYDANFSVVPELISNEKLRNNHIEWSIDRSEQIIKIEEFKLKHLKNKSALINLMAVQGWEDFDISDYVGKSNKFWKSFIGTKEEYDTLISSLNER